MITENDSVETDLTLRAEVKLYYDLYKPDTSPAPLLIALHGYGANKRQMMREARQMVPDSFAIVSLQGFHQHMKEPKEPGGPLRFGFGWLTNFHAEDSVAIHHHAVLDLINDLATQDAIDGAKVFLLGFSQTCALNYRFAFSHPHVLRGVIGMCGGLPRDWDESEEYRPTEASVFHLAGAQDEFYPPERVAKYEEQLRMRAADVTFKSYEAGHNIVPAMREDVKTWLASHLTAAAESL